MLEPGTVLQNRYAVTSVLVRSAEHVVYLAAASRLLSSMAVAAPTHALTCMPSAQPCM
jgi:hypothetical protein